MCHLVFRQHSNLDAGRPIGPGALGRVIQEAACVIQAVGKCATSFATGQFTLPNLERAWCAAACRLDEALAQTSDTVGFAKLETALDVLMCAERAPGVDLVSN
jgi:hypothetical protein